MYTETNDTTTISGARKRIDGSIVGQLNLEWAALRTDPATCQRVRAWAEAKEPLAGCTAVGDIETRTASVSRAEADQILLALLELAVADRLAGRVVLQLMLGKAVRIAASHTGRADRDLLEQLAVAALWDVIATYPIQRRRQKVAANLAMDTLRQVVAELAPGRVESPVEPDVISRHAPGDEAVDDDAPAPVVDLELFEVLAWGVDHGVLSPADASLLTRVYCPAPGEDGGEAAAAEFGLSWAAARQRCSRAVRKLATAVRADTLAAA